MEVPNLLRGELKSLTLAVHQKIESNRNLSLLLSPSLDVNHYRFILQRYLGFFRPLEKDLESRAYFKSQIPDYKNRLRTPLLIKDLQALSVPERDIDAMKDCPALPVTLGTDCETNILGISYVLEGSTLGGSIIAKKLSMHKAVPPESIHFFYGKRERTGALWQSYIKALEAAEVQNRDKSTPLEHVEWRRKITTSAVQTFTTLDSWMT